jgi:hypothetical protein
MREAHRVDEFRFLSKDWAQWASDHGEAPEDLTHENK